MDHHRPGSNRLYKTGERKFSTVNFFLYCLTKFKNGMAFGILGDPGAVSRAGLKRATKVFKHGRKSPWEPTLTGPFPNGQENAGS